MREIEFREIFRNKCYNCGCKNKVHSELMDENHRFVGYSLKCCNCGQYTEYLLDVENNGKSSHRSYKVGKQSCIQPSYCRFCNKECHLPKYKPHKEPISPLPPNRDINRCCTVTTELVHSERFL